MKKIPNEIDNPLDNILIEIADRLCPYFYSLNQVKSRLVCSEVKTVIYIAAVVIYKALPL